MKGVAFTGRNADEIIGKRFGPEKQLEVVGIHTHGYRKDMLFLVKCHNCAKDAELFGDGIFTTKINNIDMDKRPCGCSPNYSMTQDQYKTFLKRRFSDKNVDFLEFVGEFKGAKTTIKLKCLIDGHVWATRADWAVYKCACEMCGRRRNVASTTRPSEEYIKDFIATGSFPDGTTFRRSDKPGDAKTWFVSCGVCSRDGKEYKSCSSSLLYGKLPCKCGHQGGFDKTLPGYFYILRATSNCVDFTGYGITGNVKDRIDCHRTNLRKMGFALSELEYFSMHGEDAANLETAVKKNFPLFNQEVEGFMKEATYYWLYDDVIAFAEDYIANM